MKRGRKIFLACLALSLLVGTTASPAATPGCYVRKDPKSGELMMCCPTHGYPLG